ncbi:serine/threonine-protein kinase [Bifidobacterium indicum]|uniref:serine/threonine-protein kinase n=1 Tax=Bifidobacterium indicum TaxID=1691 RepID=UPI0030D79B2C
MTSQPSAALPTDVPDLQGYRYVRFLGRGGTSSVYLYEQESPSRPVAVKTNAHSQAAHELFLKEADYLARLSTHPYILTIHQAAVSGDGQDCLILEYASGGSCKTIMHSGGLDQEQTLDLGVRMASALYSAHTKGIIHRDIKPGNFLITEQGLPVLADFGISASTYGTSRAKGLSIPWAAPEVLAHRSGGSEASDIYSLGASLFGMLTGRSPYEYGYQVADEDQLAQAIILQDLPTLLRGEASPEFERVLGRAMAHDRDDRYYTALDFGRDMQEIQQEFYGHMTPFVGDGIDPFPDGGHGGQGTGQGTNADLSGLRGGTGARGNGGRPGRGDLRSGSDRPSALTEKKTPGGSKKRGPLSRGWARPALVAGAAILAAALISLVVGLVVLPGRDSIKAGTTTTAPGNETSTAIPEEPGTRGDTGDHAPVPSVVEGKGTYQGSTVTFTWRNPDPKAGDTYTWHLLGDQGGGHGSSAQTGETRAVIPQAEGGQTCISVSLVRADRRVSQEPTTICATQEQG